MDEREKRLAEKMTSWKEQLERIGDVEQHTCIEEEFMRCEACEEYMRLKQEFDACAIRYFPSMIDLCLRLMAEQEWVKVSERLPEMEHVVEVFANGRLMVACRSDADEPGTWCWAFATCAWDLQEGDYEFDDYIVSHWREIVLPTEGGKE